MAPPKKHPSTRARRNRSVGAGTLSSVSDLKVPALPDVEWLPATRDWWASIWASPMAPEYDESDVHGLFVLAALVDQFWRKPTAGLAGEIRLQRQCFGLTPLDRRRLEWEIDRGEQGAEKTTRRRAASKPKPVPKGAADPRHALSS